MQTHVRRSILLILLAGSAGLFFFDSTREGFTPAPDESRSSTPGADPAVVSPAQSVNGVDQRPPVTLPERAPIGELRTELFAPHSWQPPPPKVAARPPAPTAPPIPYKYAGKIVQEGQLSVLLANGDKVFPVKEGEVLDGTYRIESISDTRITLVYMPLAHKDSIGIVSTLPVAQ